MDQLRLVFFNMPLIVNLKLKSFIVKTLFLDWFYFRYICFKYKLSLRYQDNKQGIHILREVFSKNAYTSFFPFDQEAIVLDIGSHYGFFAIFANLHLKKNSKIYCFEPSSCNFEVLSNNLQSLQSNKIQFYQLAVAGNSTERHLALSKPQNHSLYPEYITTSTESELVNSISLEDFMTVNGIQNIDFLKIDCEGSEYEILLNASPLTLEKIDFISMEVHDMRKYGFHIHNLIDYLHENGLKIISEFSIEETLPSGFNIKMVFGR